MGLWLRHLTLPAITLSIIYIALIARVTRASVVWTQARAASDVEVGWR